MYLTENYLLKPLASVWQFFMSDEPKVIAKTQRDHPLLTLGAREGFAYTLQMKDGQQREVFVSHPDGEEIFNYTAAFFVAPQFSGDNYYTTDQNPHTQEVVTKDIIDALRAWDSDPENFKKKPYESTVRPTGVAAVVVQSATNSHQ